MPLSGLRGTGAAVGGGWHTHGVHPEGSRQVEVLRDGAWWPGTLDRWKRDERGWVGYVWWSRGPGLTHVGWVTAAELRLATVHEPPLRPAAEVFDRLQEVAAAAAGGRDAGDPWADLDVAGQ